MPVSSSANTFVPASADGRMSLLGVNTAGASFGNSDDTRGIGTSHTYPSHQTIDYYASKGMDVIRIDPKWERLQSTLHGDLNAAEVAAIDDVISYAAGKGIAVELQVHNYGKYHDGLIGSSAVPTSAFADLWGKLAARYADDPNVIFGLMNEPNQHSAEQWLPIANAGIAAIRDAGAAQQILVPGTYWDGAHSWVSSDNDTVVGAGVKDPLNNFAFEVHQYLDSDSSGTRNGVVSESIGVERLKAITQWAETTGNKLFLGEFGVATDATSLKALDNMLAYMTEHSDVWQGGTYWAAGEWWGDYAYSIQPRNGVDRPQMDVMEKYVSPQDVPYWKLEAGSRPTVPPVSPPVAGEPAAPTPPGGLVTTGSGSDSLVLRVSEDAYKGDARFTVSIDGQQVGGTFTAHAGHAQGASESFEFRGEWGMGQHKVSVAFLNDEWGGTAATDRNLYVEGATFNGGAVTGAKLDLLSAGARDFAFTDATAVSAPATNVTTGSGSDSLVLRVSEDAYKGDARFTVSIDGKQVGGTFTAHASHAQGASESFEFRGEWGMGQHKVSVAFLNDAWDGTPATDRNLYVEGATFNGGAVTGAKLDLLSAGARDFAFADTTAVPVPAAQDAMFV